MRILILNWRSLKDPLEGGAERATFEFAKRWVKDFESEVHWIAPHYDISISEEIIDGVKFHYVGGPLNRNLFQLVYRFPLFYFGVVIKYFKLFRGHIDVVIDQVHGIPYLTPLYVKEKKVVYIHEVAGAIWHIMYPFPVVLLGRFCESVMFLVYRLFNVHFVANSPSTEADLLSKLKIEQKNISTVFYGVTAPVLPEVPQKPEVFTMIYLNRLVKMKGIERGLKVFQLVKAHIPSARFQVVGRGEDGYVNFLKDYCSELGILDSVDFLGFIDGSEKFDLLGKAHVLINPSYLEGWGLVNIEANRMGTPVVAFNVRGCSDSVQHGVSGYLSDDDDLEGMASNILKLQNDTELCQKALEYSKQFDWDRQAKIFYEVLL